MAKSEKIKEPKTTRSRLIKALTIFAFVVAILLLLFEGLIYYQRSYLTPFWVNGQSMYPTLNQNATDAQGHLLGVNGGSVDDGYVVDYGVMDEHKAALKKIKRFDIVVTKYNLDDTKDKIKRVIGLPGETIYFVSTGKGNEHNGELYINDKFIEQPISTDIIKNGDYPTEKIVLKSDEYYVCGDNRGHSSDSLLVGPIKKDYIKGKVIAICGTAVVCSNASDIKDIKYFWPRFL